MADSIDSETRSKVMGRVRQKDTGPEMTLRRLIHSAGYRYRLHDKRLPGTPDLVFRSKKKVIFVNGCFWHAHENCPLAYPPKSRLDYWLPKLKKNKDRDMRNEKLLKEMGWKVLVVWQCELKNPEEVLLKVSRFLDLE